MFLGSCLGFVLWKVESGEFGIVGNIGDDDGWWRFLIKMYLGNCYYYMVIKRYKNCYFGGRISWFVNCYFCFWENMVKLEGEFNAVDIFSLMDKGIFNIYI